MTESRSNPCPHVRAVERNGSGTGPSLSVGSPNVSVAREKLRDETRVLVCGSRDWADRGRIKRRLADLPDNTVVIVGGAPGADTFAQHEAHRRGLHVAIVPALWQRYRASAGPRRNRAMLDLAPGLVIAFHADNSRGTQDTIDEARRRSIPVEVHTA